MLKHRGGVLTTYGAATPQFPEGFACASLGGLAEHPMEPATAKAARRGGTGPSASLELLDVAQGYAFEAPPCIGSRGARNAARPTYATPF